MIKIIMIKIFSIKLFDIWKSIIEINCKEKWRSIYKLIICYLLYFPLIIMRLFNFILQLIENYQWNLLWKILFNYQKKAMLIDIGWNTVKTSAIICVPIEFIRAGIETKEGIKSLRLEETPHYKYIKSIIDNTNIESEYLDYEYYMKTYQKGRNTEDDKNKLYEIANDISCKFKSGINDCFIITNIPNISLRQGLIVELYDGVHRAVIAKACGIKIINCLLLSK